MIYKSSKVSTSSQDAGDRIAQLELLPAWHKPVLIRMQLKRTLQDGGSGTDFSAESDLIAAANKP